MKRFARLPVAGFVILFAAGGCQTHSVQTATPAIPVAFILAEGLPGVAIEPKTLDLSRSENATIRYDLTEPAEVTVELVDADGRVARALAESKPAGSQQTVWDGKDSAGNPVPVGVYRYVITARLQSGRVIRHDPSASTGGEELTVHTFTYDEETGQLYWVMPKAGYARIRVGIEGFPHLKTVLDWQPMEAGEHTLAWDGLDASGLINVKSHPKRLIKIAAYSMPDNTVIISGSPTMSGAGSAPAYPADLKAPPAYLHARHRREQCGEIHLTASFLKPGLKNDKQGRPIVSGVVLVRVTLDPRDVARVINSRYEVALYEDTNFLFEEEDAVHPFSFDWDTRGLTAGVHLLTVNILTYDDHFGVLTVPVIVEPAR